MNEIIFKSRTQKLIHDYVQHAKYLRKVSSLE